MGLFHSALTSEEIDVPEGHYEEEQMKATVVPNRNAIFRPYSTVMLYLLRCEGTKVESLH